MSDVMANLTISVEEMRGTVESLDFSDFNSDLSNVVLSSDEYVKMSSELEYQGVSPELVYKALFSKYLSSTNSPSILDFYKDLCVLSWIGLNRGSHLDKIMKKTSKNGKKSIDILKSKYRIEGKPINNETITINRIMSCIPSLTMTIAIKYGCRWFVPGFDGTDMMDYYCLPGCASLIPRGTRGDKIEAHVANFGVELSKLIDSSKTKTYDATANFVKIARAGKVSEHIRTRIWSLLEEKFKNQPIKVSST